MQVLSRKKLRLVTMDTNVSLEQRQYVKNYLMNQRKVWITQITIFVVLVALWEIGAQTGFIDAFIFSSPSRVARTIYEMVKNGTLFYHLGITLYETLLSFAFVNIFGITIAVLLWWNHNISKVLEPYLVVLNSLPKSALAPVFIVWLGNNMKTIIIAAVSVSVFGTIITLYTDFKSVEEDKIKLIRTLGGTKKDILWRVVLPSNIPSMISLMKVNIGLSLVGVIIGEFLAARAGLGYLIIYGSQVFKLDFVIMSIILLCVLATALYKGLGILEKRYGEHS